MYTPKLTVSLHPVEWLPDAAGLASGWLRFQATLVITIAVLRVWASCEGCHHNDYVENAIAGVVLLVVTL